jgi:hypothetical protein
MDEGLVLTNYSNFIPSGQGNSLSSGYLEYSFWLTHPIADLQENRVGYYGFGFQLYEGWNTLSTPMAL